MLYALCERWLDLTVLLIIDCIPAMRQKIDCASKVWLVRNTAQGIQITDQNKYNSIIHNMYYITCTSRVSRIKLRI